MRVGLTPDTASMDKHGKNNQRAQHIAEAFGKQNMRFIRLNRIVEVLFVRRGRVFWRRMIAMPSVQKHSEA